MSAYEVIRSWKDENHHHDAHTPTSPVGDIFTEAEFLKLTGGSSVDTASGYTTCETHGSKCTFVGQCCF